MNVITEKTRYRFDDAGHMHSLDGKPLIGTTTAMDVLSKPLTWWASGMACAEFGWVHERNAEATERQQRAQEALSTIKGLNPFQYLEKLDKAYRAHDTLKRSAAGEGTDIHAKLERYVLNCLMLHGGEPQAPPDDAKPGPTRFFAEWACDNIEKFLWAEGHCYSEVLWTGGICDCGARLKGLGQIAAIDFKRAKGVYFSHMVQLAGYAYQIAENGLFTDTGTNIVAPLMPDDMIVFAFGGKEIRREECSLDYRSAFCDVVHLYKLQKDFDTE